MEQELNDLERRIDELQDDTNKEINDLHEAVEDLTDRFDTLIDGLSRIGASFQQDLER